MLWEFHRWSNRVIFKSGMYYKPCVTIWAWLTFTANKTKLYPMPRNNPQQFLWVPCGFALVPFVKFLHKFTFSYRVPLTTRGPLHERNSRPAIHSGVTGIELCSWRGTVTAIFLLVRGALHHVWGPQQKNKKKQGTTAKHSSANPQLFL